MLHKPPVPLARGVTQHLQPFRITPAQLSVSLSMCLGPPIQQNVHSASNTVPCQCAKKGRQKWKCTSFDTLLFNIFLSQY